MNPLTDDLDGLSAACGLTLAQLGRIHGLIAAAALDPTRWSETLAAIRAGLPGIRAHMFGYDAATGQHLGMLQSGYDPLYIASYNDHYGDLNAWAPGFFAHPGGTVVHSERMCSREAMQATEFYQDWVRPQENIVAGGGALLFRDAQRMFAIGGNIRDRDREPLEHQWLALVAHLLPHLTQAFEVNRALANMSLELYAAGQTGGGGSAVFLVDRRARILYANTPAWMQVERGTIVRQDRVGRLLFTDGRATDALAGFLRPSARRSVATIALPGHTARLMDVDPAHLRHDPRGCLVGLGEPVLLLVLAAHRHRADAANAAISAAGLTAAEAAIARGLGEGLTVAQLAANREVSVHTVRTQLKAAMAKLGVRRQAELVALVMGSR